MHVDDQGGARNGAYAARAPVTCTPLSKRHHVSMRQPNPTALFLGSHGRPLVPFIFRFLSYRSLFMIFPTYQ